MITDDNIRTLIETCAAGADGALVVTNTEAGDALAERLRPLVLERGAHADHDTWSWSSPSEGTLAVARLLCPSRAPAELLRRNRGALESVDRCLFEDDVPQGRLCALLAELDDARRLAHLLADHRGSRWSDLLREDRSALFAKARDLRAASRRSLEEHPLKLTVTRVHDGSLAPIVGSPERLAAEPEPGRAPTPSRSR